MKICLCCEYTNIQKKIELGFYTRVIILFMSLWQEYAKAFLIHSFTITGISTYLRKIALRLKLKKVIERQGDQYIIKTLSTFRNYAISFKIGQEFEEFTKGLDNRHIKVRTDVVNVPLKGVCMKHETC